MLAKLAMAGTLGVLALGGIAIAQEQPNTDPSALNKGVPTGTYDTWVPHGIANTLLDRSPQQQTATTTVTTTDTMTSGAGEVSDETAATTEPTRTTATTTDTVSTGMGGSGSASYSRAGERG